MPNPLLSRRRILALKSETVIGTAVSLAAADAGFKVEDRALRIVRASGRRENQASGGSDVAIAEAAHTELSFTARMAGKGAAGVPALAAVLFPALGFKLTGSTFSRTWDTSLWKSISAGSYADGVAVLGRGLMGNARIALVPGGMATISPEMQGGWVSNPTDTALLAGVTYESSNPPIWTPGAGAALTIDGQTIFKPATCDIDLGNEVSLREDPNSPGGFVSGWIGAGAARITLDPEAYTRATYDWFAKQAANATFAFQAVLDGGTNNTITIDMTAQVVEAPDWTDRNGKVAERLVLGEVNDSLTIAYS